MDPPGNMGFNLNPGTYGLVANVSWGRLFPADHKSARLRFIIAEESMETTWERFRERASVDDGSGQESR